MTVSISDMASGKRRLVHAAIIEQWDFFGETFATTLTAMPHYADAVFSVTHLGTGLYAVRSLNDWRNGQLEFNKIVSKYGKGAVLASIARGYKATANQPRLHFIGPNVWIYDAHPYRNVFEVWARADGDKSTAAPIKAFDNLAAATQLANVINSLRNPPKLASRQILGPLPKL